MQVSGHVMDSCWVLNPTMGVDARARRAAHRPVGWDAGESATGDWYGRGNAAQRTRPALGRRLKNRLGFQARYAQSPAVWDLRSEVSPRLNIFWLDRFGIRNAWRHGLQSEGKPDGQRRDSCGDRARPRANIPPSRPSDSTCSLAPRTPRPPIRGARNRAIAAKNGQGEALLTAQSGCCILKER
jgi:hypothetical protein